MNNILPEDWVFIIIAIIIFGYAFCHAPALLHLLLQSAGG